MPDFGQKQHGQLQKLQKLVFVTVVILKPQMACHLDIQIVINVSII